MQAVGKCSLMKLRGFQLWMQCLYHLILSAHKIRISAVDLLQYKMISKVLQYGIILIYCLYYSAWGSQENLLWYWLPYKNNGLHSHQAFPSEIYMKLLLWQWRLSQVAKKSNNSMNKPCWQHAPYQLIPQRFHASCLQHIKVCH